ncbi:MULTISPECIES: regulatory protein RecX [Halomonadaceae]|uniref:regulatory protein RecX n=1 Tax=Halomonadaceae TaxID=28256 RepID=UPI00159904C7|nr:MULTISPECIES: regulatory protein RecX [Halomonas]QJQ95089.1 regulatory protein RecX [Halomonas sp. PA5]
MLGTSDRGDSSPRDDAIRLLARRDYSRFELQSRLAAKGHADSEVSACLDQLAEQGLQCDQRFLESFLRSRVSRGQGLLKIRAELGKRGVSRELIAQALAETDQDWYALACETLARRFDGPGGDPRERARRERFLAGRGFDFDQVRHALANAWND